MHAPLLVLGSRVTDGEPGKLLVTRLNKTLEMARTYPGDIIVSGYGEADPMRRYLEARGIPAERIICERAASSTNENLENARRLAPDAVVLHTVTNDFHGLRTRLWAWHLGIPVKLHLTATPWALKPRNYIREIFATPHSAARIVWRRIKAALEP